MKYDIILMKKRTLTEEINRIKKLNELFADDNDDYLYDPEYYERDDEDEDDEPTPQYDENGELIEPPDFEEDLTLGPNASSANDSTEISEPEPETVERTKKEIHHYDREKTDQIHELLMFDHLQIHKGDLTRDMIDEPVLQFMIKDFLVKPTDDFGHDRMFGFNYAKRGGGEINPIKDYGYANITPANKSIIKDKNKFHIYTNNLIDIYNKKLSLKKYTDNVIGPITDRRDREYNGGN
jgi:hypothetical protein